MGDLKLGIMGLSDGNGHPYSWAAIFNGCDREKMALCPFPVIPEYLGQQPPEAFGIDGARVTHIWTQDEEVSRAVAGASLIENIVSDAPGMIGKVDAVLLARDDGENHLEMARPFIEAGVPVFIDKPLTDRYDDLKQFVRYYEEGRALMSCSSFRYADGIVALKKGLGSGKGSPGRILTASAVIQKYWRTYGIHMIEGIYAVMGGGFKSVQTIGRKGEEIVHLDYEDGRHAVIQTFARIRGASLTFFGEEGVVVPEDSGAFQQFKSMLAAFVEMLKTGKQQFDWHETVEMAKVVVAGQLSLEEGGRVVRLEEIAV